MKATTIGWILSLLLTTSIGNAGEYLVKYKNMAALNNMAAMETQAIGLQMKSLNRVAHLVKVQIDKKNEARAMVALYSDKNVEYVVPNFKIHSFMNPVTVTSLREQYSLAKVNAEQAWKRAGNKGSRNVILAIIDTGVDYKHPNLAPNVVAGYDFKDNDADPMDVVGSQNPGHGTHCAGIVGATGLIDGGVQGMSPEVSIMPLRFLDKNGSGDLNNAIKAIDYAIDKKVDVISA